MPIRPRYSERQRTSEPRNVVDVTDTTKTSLNVVFQTCIFNVSRGYVNSTECTHCFGEFHFEINALSRRVLFEIGRINDLSIDQLFPTDETFVIFDLIEVYFEFIIENIRKRQGCGGGTNCVIVNKSKTIIVGVNRVFERDKIAYELNNEGQIVRIGAPIISHMIESTMFDTGDAKLDGLFETARDKFISRDPAVRRDGLEKLWDAWERLKTLEVPGDKKASTSALLDGVTVGPIRDRLECESRELTDIGNQFMIRHSETDRHPLDDDRHVDYLFHRMFSLVYLLLDGTGRVGRDG